MYIRITDNDTPSYSRNFSKKVLDQVVNARKATYLQPYIDRRRSFTPLVYLVDEMACKEEKVFEKRIASHLARK